MKGKIELTRKLNQVGSSLMLTIPSQLAKVIGWQKGDVIKIKINDKGDLILNRYIS